MIDCDSNLDGLRARARVDVVANLCRGNELTNDGRIVYWRSHGHIEYYFARGRLYDPSSNPNVYIWADGDCSGGGTNLIDLGHSRARC